MASNVDPERLGVHALGDDQNLPLREQLGVIRDEITALQDAGGSAGSDLAGRVAALEASASALDSKVTDLESRVATLESAAPAA